MPRVTPENRIPDIVRAAVEVFSRKGYRLAQMEEIAERAGVSKATLYYYFESKLHLFQYVLENAVAGGDGELPSSKGSPPRSEDEFLRYLKARLRKGTRLKSVQVFLKRDAAEIDVAEEIAGIVEELWDISERNRIQIVVLEKSFFEFPELAEVYSRHGRRQMLLQLEEYLRRRIEMGAIRRLRSVAATARFMLESLAWFGFKQFATPSETYPKSETLPDLISIFVHGLRK
ncbi:MAG: hypothetical protein Kow0099_25380 [Candidatus Abyssubacteria bacterium]